jgi:hypothetical protein
LGGSLGIAVRFEPDGVSGAVAEGLLGALGEASLSRGTEASAGAVLVCGAAAKSLAGVSEDPLAGSAGTSLQAANTKMAEANTPNEARRLWLCFVIVLSL